VLSAWLNVDLVAALSTTNKIGLGVTASHRDRLLARLVAAHPAARPGLPRRALPAFLAATVVLFVAMLAAVEVFGVESEEGRRARGAGPRRTWRARRQRNARLGGRRAPQLPGKKGGSRQPGVCRTTSFPPCP
jgi:hypothetical protein